MMSGLKNAYDTLRKTVYDSLSSRMSKLELVAFAWNVWVSIFVMVDYYNVFNLLTESLAQYVVSILASFVATVQFLYLIKKATLKYYRLSLYISMTLWVYIAIYEVFDTNFHSLLVGALFVISWINLFAVQHVNAKYRASNDD